MEQKEKVIKKKIERLAENILSSETYQNPFSDDSINDQLDEEIIYKNCEDDLIKKVLPVLHSKLNKLLEFMNKKGRSNKHYNADESRELLEIIDNISKLKKWYKELGYTLEIDKNYSTKIDYVKSFLQETGGSAIPEDFQDIEIEEINPIFEFSKDNLFVKTTKQPQITSKFAKEQIRKIDAKIKDKDYDGAITNCRSLLENIFREVYQIKTQKTFEAQRTLIGDWKTISRELNLVPENYPDGFLRQILQGLISIINGISYMRNKMSDSHSISFRPHRHHAVLAHNCTLTVIDFLFDSLTYQQKNKAEMTMGSLK